MSKARPAKGVYWLASYPKSGNTWTRSFIQASQNYQDLSTSKKQQPILEAQEEELKLTESGLIDINSLQTGAIASDRSWVEQILGFNIADFHQDEVDLLRPDAYRWFAQQRTGLGYHKIHDAYTYLPGGTPMIPPEATLGALCLIRNPLDVAISFANHMNCSIDESIMMMGNPDYALCSGQFRLEKQLRQWLLSWSKHVNSWTQAKDLNRLVVRYEDMKQTPLKTFTKMAKFLQLPAKRKTIELILEQIKIERFQEQESAEGFKEKSSKVKRFFRKGIVGDWQQTLSPQQIQRVIDEHYEVMQKFGYLDASGKPTDLIQAQ